MTSALCQCGCGQLAPLAPYTHRMRGWIEGEPIQFVHGHNRRGSHRVTPSGANNPNWKGGARETHGYIATRQGIGRAARYKPAHVVNVESVIGRELPLGAVVHHVDENKANNANQNLVALQSRGEHNELHRKIRVRRAGGNPWTDRICCDCHRPKPAGEFYLSTTKARGVVYDSRCVECSRANGRKKVA